MTAARRWCLAALVTAVVIAVPQVGRLLPATESDLDAGELFALVASEEDHPYSGYVETTGTLQLPVADRFDSAGSLFGESNRLRVWWRGRHDWRVARLLTAGENDLVHRGRTTTEYDYEEAAATTSVDPRIRLPRTADLLPPEVARRFLGGAGAGDVTRLPARRVAGISAPGLRIEGDAARSSIRRVDLWADPDTGVPLRVEVLARGSDGPDFTAAFVDFTAAEPSREVVSFHATPQTESSFDDVIDIADAANQDAPLQPPAPIAGLARTSTGDGAVGVYGGGLTQVIAIPVRDREADPVREQIRATPGAEVLPTVGVATSAGPLGVLLTGDDGPGGWLVAGTVTRPVLRQAAVDLIRDSVVLEYRR